MTQDGLGQSLDVIRGDVRTLVQERPHLAAQHQVLTGTRTRAPLDELLDPCRRIRVARPGSANQVQHHVHHVLGHRYLAHNFLALFDLFTGENGLDLALTRAGRLQNNLTLLITIRVVDLDH